MKIVKDRYYLLDGIRGFAIINMILYHFCYDMFIIYGYNPGWIGRMPAIIWQQCICWTFILISGMVWPISAKANGMGALKRGLFLNLAGLLITVVTRIAMPGETVWFGILNFLGCAVWLMIPLHKLFSKIYAPIGFVGSMILFFLFRHVTDGVLGFGNFTLVHLPTALYDIKWLTIFGFPFAGFSSSDYFPILPWLFLFCAGYFIGKYFLQKESWKEKAKLRIPVLTWIGQKSIWIYLIHQPVCMAIATLLSQH